MGTPTICICENKDADQLRSNCEADQRLCFRYTDSTIPLLFKSKITSFWPASVDVQPALCQIWSKPHDCWSSQAKAHLVLSPTQASFQKDFVISNGNMFTIPDTNVLVFVGVMAALALFAILSNMMLIYCVFRVRKLRTVTNIFICNLSVSDIFLAGFTMPQKLHDIFHKDHFHEGNKCNFSQNLFVV